MSYSANVTVARIRAGGFMLDRAAMGTLTPGPVTVVIPGYVGNFVGRVAPLQNQNQGYCYCRDLYLDRNNVGSIVASLPLQLGDQLEYAVRAGEIHLVAIHRAGTNPTPSNPASGAAPSAGVTSTGGSSPPTLPPGASADDVIAAMVRWIQNEPFQRQQRIRGNVKPVAGALPVTGWDARIKEYSYAKSLVSNFDNVFAVRAFCKAALNTIRTNYNWLNVAAGLQPIAQADRAVMEGFAEMICLWGGVKQGSYASASDVITSAMTGTPLQAAPMNSGWTKVASFATDGLANSQTIWDSRASTAVVSRIDEILYASQLDQAVMNTYDIGLIPSTDSGTRALRLAGLHFNWPNGYGKWNYHFGGSAVVRRIVAILNDPRNGYPRIPQPGGAPGVEWDVFAVGLVLFMDGW